MSFQRGVQHCGMGVEYLDVTGDAGHEEALAVARDCGLAGVGCWNWAEFVVRSVRVQSRGQVPSAHASIDTSGY